MTYNEETNTVHITVTILEHRKSSKEYNSIDIDVVLVVRRLFYLSRKCNLLYTDTEMSFVEENVRRMLERNSSHARTLKRT